MNGAAVNLYNMEFAPILNTMKSAYGINTITVYGMESWYSGRVASLLSALAERDMRLVPRIEAYNPDTFVFSIGDARSVAKSYTQLTAQLNLQKSAVSYLAVNMPVDDGRVHRSLKGLNSPQWVAAQVEYSRAIVSELRKLTDIRLYLSVFYGWDNSYAIPSYADAEADGYFLTNYSYPSGNYIASENDSVQTIINSDRLLVAPTQFVRQYGSYAPVVVEYGFQTMENHTQIPAQTAGLVRNKATKTIALKATTEFYNNMYANVEGTMYFGYNLNKVEGNPPALIDFGLIP